MNRFKNPWIWIGLIFGAQSVGAILFVRLFGVQLKPVLPGFLLLLSGTVLSFIFASRRKAGKESPWMAAVPVAIYCLFIFSMSHNSPTSQVSVNGDYFHPVIYATVGILLSWACRSILLKKGAPTFIALVMGIGTAYAFSDELHQSFIPGRCASPLDIALDVLGLGVACFVFIMSRAVWGGSTEQWDDQRT